MKKRGDNIIEYLIHCNRRLQRQPFMICIMVTVLMYSKFPLSAQRRVVSSEENQVTERTHFPEEPLLEVDRTEIDSAAKDRDGSIALNPKTRLLVLTDIGGDPDDQQSMIRLMLYANEFDIEGLIASASGTPGELKEKVTKPDLIREIVKAYEQVRPNLSQHAKDYPLSDSLLTKIKSGNSNRGRGAIGENHDTEGSLWIIKAVDEQDPRPLNIAIWGGQTDLAQALWRVRRDRSEQETAQFIDKLRVHDIADQDGLAEWITTEFPNLFYILNAAPQGRDKREAVFRGLYLGGDESLVSREWMQHHIRENHGPLGALYPPKTWTAPNPHSAIKEGDTPSWFCFLKNGLQDADHPEWGGWGGRFVRERNERYRDAVDCVGDTCSARATVWRWRRAFQADFQARLDWCVTPDVKSVNHAPMARLNGDESGDMVFIKTRSGATVNLSAEGSVDPDGNAVMAHWFIYPEAGTCDIPVYLSSLQGDETSFIAPVVRHSQTIHIILEVRDDGEPALSDFRRAIVTVIP